MNLFVIGDVHGCYHTFQELLQHWQPQQELLIQLGDLMDRGNFSPETVALAMQLAADHPEQAVFLKGNHELGMLRHYTKIGGPTTWLNWGGNLTVQQYEKQPELLGPHLAWIQERPLVWQNDHVVVSHAGFADTPNPLSEANADGVLWRRGPLRNVGKLQVIGHTPTLDGEPLFDPEANALNIDTAAVYGRTLTGARISSTGELLQTLSIPTHAVDSERGR
ncbi:metallophosphoesterase family protein [Hymenobacter jejuensis]|uniref:Serine/threonine protein phosphatase n=1 Tax=Hymenobacter jejuensis TaxID=2502781 RepID=A0A5B8A249_9BACT|nr:metallophosphoesterase family protein [Hymenobacter jejuensis]QDA60272.1 serine/threonine protein phosphatase [Hymenobacter jejuensis]